MNKRVYIIAEIGCNHNGDLDLARQLVEEAAKAKVDAVKFQLFKSTDLISTNAPKANYQLKTTNPNESQLEMTKKLELNFADYVYLKGYANSLGLDAFATPFDEHSLQQLININTEVYKIPSGEITNVPLLEKIASTRKKIILSTGMATIDEIRYALNIFEQANCEDITVLHCTTEYPAPVDELNLNVISTFKKEFPYPIGYSDHTKGTLASAAAVALGCKVIEKHFTLDHNLPGPDHKASATPDELTKMVTEIRYLERALGKDTKLVTKHELENQKVARKSLVAKKEIKKGEVFSNDNLCTKRPGTGISPIHWHKIIGTISDEDYKKDELIRNNGGKYV